MQITDLEVYSNKQIVKLIKRDTIVYIDSQGCWIHASQTWLEDFRANAKNPGLIYYRAAEETAHNNHRVYIAQW